MKKHLSLLLSSLLLLAVHATGHAAAPANQPALKPGLWEFSSSTLMSGTAKPVEMKQKSCVAGPEAGDDAEEDTPYKDVCKTTKSQTSNSWKETTVCKHSPTWSQTSEMTITLQGDTAMTMKGSNVNVEDGKTLKMETTGTGKWLSKDCGNIKPSNDWMGK